MKKIVEVEYDPMGYFLQVGERGASCGECIVQWLDACESDLIILQEHADGVRAVAFVWDGEVFPCTAPEHAILETEANGRVRFMFNDNPGQVRHQFLSQQARYLAEMWCDDLEGVTQVAITPLLTSAFTAPATSQSSVPIVPLGDFGVAQLRPAVKSTSHAIRPNTEFDELGVLILEEIDGIITAVLIERPEAMFGPNPPTRVRVEIPRGYDSAWRFCFQEGEAHEVWNVYSRCGRYQFFLGMGEKGLQTVVLLPRGHSPA